MDVFISAEPGNWQLVGSSPMPLIATQIAARIAASQYFNQQPILAALVADNNRPSAVLYKRPWGRVGDQHYCKLVTKVWRSPLPTLPS